MSHYKRTSPKSLLYLQALLPRLSPNHKHFNDLQTEAAIRQKGFNGEKKLDYHLQMLDNDYKILHDITLSYKRNRFQIDSLIITPHAIFIVDSKSIDGIITFNTTLQQLTQNHQGIERSLKYPITQLESIKFLLMKWLELRNLTGFPIFYFVSIADSSSILRVDGDEAFIRKYVSYAENIPHLLMKKNEQMAKFSINNVNLQRNIISTIFREKEDLFIDLSHKYHIKRHDIAPGVVCSNCYRLQTVYIRGVWSCKNCGFKDKKGYLSGFRDFFILFGNGISNREARWFLGVENRSTVTRIFQRSNLRYDKKNKRWYK